MGPYDGFGDGPSVGFQLGRRVGSADGFGVGASVGFGLGTGLGSCEGFGVGLCDGFGVGAGLGSCVGFGVLGTPAVGFQDGRCVGLAFGFDVGCHDGRCVGEYVFEDVSPPDCAVAAWCRLHRYTNSTAQRFMTDVPILYQRNTLRGRASLHPPPSIWEHKFA